MPENMAPEAVNREKNNAALSSVFAAILLTGLKLVIGLMTNSLGLLSEAAHSGFDLIAACITFFAVRYAANPADSNHPYGHGKIENLSALVESLLLLITCVWIVWEAINRLFFTTVEVEPSLWALGVMVVSIVVDISRSRMLMRVAKKHKSQALEADALHFSTDILSSAVVILGLCALYVARWLPAESALRPWLEQADSVAALGVSMIVIKVSLTLGKQAVNILLDSADRGIANTLSKTVSSINGVQSIERLRVRHGGPTVFVDLIITVSSTLAADQLDALRQEVEKQIRKAEHTADIVLELRSPTPDNESIIARARALAAISALDVHAIELFTLDGKGQNHSNDLLQLHVEIEPDTILSKAHDQINKFEARLRQEFPFIKIVSHLEPKGHGQQNAHLLEGEEVAYVTKIIKEIVAENDEVHDCHHILLHSDANGKRLSFHCRMAGDTTVIKANAEARHLQATLQKRMPELNMVTVHMEPQT